MRTFIAIDIPEEIKKELIKIQKQLPEFKGKLTEKEDRKSVV
jgi:2'-5' RNA ligase